MTECCEINCKQMLHAECGRMNKVPIVRTMLDENLSLSFYCYKHKPNSLRSEMMCRRMESIRHIESLVNAFTKCNNIVKASRTEGIIETDNEKPYGKRKKEEKNNFQLLNRVKTRRTFLDSVNKGVIEYIDMTEKTTNPETLNEEDEVQLEEECECDLTLIVACSNHDEE